MDILRDAITGETIVRLAAQELASRATGEVTHLIAEKLADKFIEQHGAAIIAQIDVQTIANLASLRLGAKSEKQAEAYLSDGARK